VLPNPLRKIHDCEWDAETNTISTPEQIADEKRMAEIEKAEALFDGERSVKTLEKSAETQSPKNS